MSSREPASRSRSAAAVPPASRRPLRDNPRLLLAGIVLLLGVLGGVSWMADRTSRLAPDFLASVVLSALSATNLMMLLALVFVLARNVIKLVVERRSAMPFARFRTKLVAVLLGLTLVPTLLVLGVGSQVVLTAIDRWFNAPMDEVLSSASGIATEYYRERQESAGGEAVRIARALGREDLQSGDLSALRDAVTPDVRQRRVGVVHVYRARADRSVQPLVEVAAPGMPSGTRASADRLALRAAGGDDGAWSVEPAGGGAELVRAARQIRDASGRMAGVVVVGDLLGGELAGRARRLTQAYEDYQQLRVLKQPLAGVYLSFFVMVTLLILVGSTWLGFYLSKRITRPAQLLAVAAREIGAGRFDHRVSHTSSDEFGDMITAFNTMASELAAGRARLEEEARALSSRHQEVDVGRRAVETILERIATGVVSIGPDGRIARLNVAAQRLLGLDGSVVGAEAAAQFRAAGLEPLVGLLDDAVSGSSESVAREIALTLGDREAHLATVATQLRTTDGTPDGCVVVVDDVTPLIRAQKVAAWREVARRLAHEIKNPLTPIQLSAERLRRKLGGPDAPEGALVEECTGAIISEVQSLKELVDEFAQFARMPAPRAVPTDLHRVLEDTLALFDGLFPAMRIERRLAASLPLVRLDADQIKRVILNLVDNAVEATGREGVVTVETSHDPTNRLVRVVVADDGPGIPPAERDKLFLPYYSTKQRGSGLGLAIVRRIVAEHGGNIEVTDNDPHGSRFCIELPA